MFSRSLTLSAVLLLAAGHTVEAQELRIRDVEWGFDGRVTASVFNPVSILIDNPNEDAFEGSLSLRLRTGTGQSVGATLSENDLYIEPLGTRWVQFVPFIGQFPDNGTWQLRWRPDDRTRRGGSTQLPPSKSGREAVVYLSKSSGFSSSTRGVRHFSEEIFPTAVSATSGLRSVILDHVPRWERPRRQAFIDWIRLGGYVHLLRDDDDQYPAFTDELAVLNDPRPQQRVGAGVVFRHEETSSDLDSKFPERVRRVEDVYLKVSADEANDALDDAIREQQRGQVRFDPYAALDHGPWPKSEAFHSRLMQMTLPEHNWPLIYLLSLAYILIIFPGCYIVGKRRSHYLVTYGAIIGAAFVFSLAFLFVGRRGYGEQTAVNAVAVARQIEGDRWDVTQWSNAFVTRGDSYELTHQGVGLVYSSGQQNEPVNGRIALRRRDDGKVERTFGVDIPPFSSRPFVHRQTLRLPGLACSISSLSRAQDLTDVTIEVGEQFPEASEHMLVVYRDTVYRLRMENGMLRKGSRLGTIGQFIKTEALTTWGGADMWYDTDQTTNAERYKLMFHTGMAHLFGLQEQTDLARAQIPPDRLRLIVYGRMPKDLFVTGAELGNQQGYVLFCQDLPIEETP